MRLWLLSFNCLCIHPFKQDLHCRLSDKCHQTPSCELFYQIGGSFRKKATCGDQEEEGEGEISGDSSLHSLRQHMGIAHPRHMGQSARHGDLGMGECGPWLALKNPVMGTGRKQENDYVYNTVSGGEKCSNLCLDKNSKEIMERINERACKPFWGGDIGLQLVWRKWCEDLGAGSLKRGWWQVKGPWGNMNLSEVIAEWQENLLRLYHGVFEFGPGFDIWLPGLKSQLQAVELWASQFISWGFSFLIKKMGQYCLLHSVIVGLSEAINAVKRAS